MKRPDLIGNTFNRADLAGQRFGKLTIIGFSHTKKRKAFWECLCDCGNKKVAGTKTLRNGECKSCGCLQKEAAAKTSKQYCLSHGGFGTRLYKIWGGIIDRCENKNAISYEWYGARGIRICPEWRHNFVAFREWALSHDYADNLTIDRIDNDGNYEPSNCHWITRSENSRKARQNTIIKRKQSA